LHSFDDKERGCTIVKRPTAKHIILQIGYRGLEKHRHVPLLRAGIVQKTPGLLCTQASGRSISNVQYKGLARMIRTSLGYHEGERALGLMISGYALRIPLHSKGIDSV
jgi:hypothetical protein